MLNKTKYIEGLQMENFDNWGEGFEYAMVVRYDTTRYYPYSKASKSGDMVAMGTHYQVKGHRGFFQGVEDIEQLEHHLYKECKAHRYLLRVTGKEKFWWVDVDKAEVLELARQGYIKFEDGGKSRGPVARWTLSAKQALHFTMWTGIEIIKESIV